MVRSAATPLAPGSLDDLPEPTWASMLGRGLPQFMGEAVAPVLVFFGVWKAAGLGPAVVASTVVYLVLAVLLLRRGRDIALIAIGAVFVVIQAIVGLASHSATVYLAQPVVLNALWGVACFASIAIGRPVIGVLAGAWYPFPAWFRASAAFRREFSVQSAVFGAFYLARAALRLWVLLATGVGGLRGRVGPDRHAVRARADRLGRVARPADIQFALTNASRCAAT